MAVAWEEIIDQNSRPLTVLAQMYLVGSLRAVVLRDQHFLKQLRTLGKHRQRTQKPVKNFHVITAHCFDKQIGSVHCCLTTHDDVLILINYNSTKIK